MNNRDISILIADSDRIVRENISEFLTNFDYTVETTATNKKLIEVVRTKSVQVILMECSYNEQDVINTIDEINFCNPKIVVMVMLSNPTIKRLLKLVGVGIQNILIKPLSLNDFKETIEKAVQQYQINFEYQLFKENRSIILKSLDEQGVKIPDSLEEKRTAVLEV